jgi:hypothetical protein
VLPSARRLRNLGAAAGDREVPTPAPIEVIPRQIVTDDLFSAGGVVTGTESKNGSIAA